MAFSCRCLKGLVRFHFGTDKAPPQIAPAVPLSYQAVSARYEGVRGLYKAGRVPYNGIGNGIGNGLAMGLAPGMMGARRNGSPVRAVLQI